MPGNLPFIRKRAIWLMLIAFAVPAMLSIEGSRAQSQPNSPKEAPVRTSPLQPGWDAVDQRMVFLTVQLSTVESTITATNKSLRTHGYQQAARQAAADRAREGNERMDRNGGGPVPWQEFYGQTAEKFFYHPSGNDTIYVNPDAVAQRPPQFDYIYRANEERSEQATDDVQKIGDKIEDLLAYRRQLEAEQSALWGKIAFRGDSSLDVSSRPLYRMDLAPIGSDDASKQSAEAAKAAIVFMTAIDAELTEAQKNLSSDQQGTFDHLLQTTTSLRAALNAKLLELPAMSASLSDPRTSLGQFSRAAKRLEDSAQNIVDAFRLAADSDSKDDQAGKQTYRGQLQQMVFDYASTFTTADQSLVAAVTGWKLKQIGAIRSAPATQPTPDTDDIVGRLDAAKEARERAVIAARRALMKTVDGRLDSAADAGDLALVQSLAAAKIAVAHEGTVPADIKDPAILDAQSQSQKSIAAANGDLVAAYHVAIVSYTKSREFTDAEAVQNELNAFVQDAKFTVATGAQTANSGTGEHAVARPAPVAPLGKITRLTRVLPHNWQCDGTFEVNPKGILLPDIHYIRSTTADFLNRDFTLDLWLTIDPKNPTAFIGVGSGENGIHATPVNSIFMVIHPSGDITMSTREGYGDSGMGKEEDSGEYVVRLEKKGMAVTYSIGSIERNGDFTADVTQTFSDISKTPASFNEKNMHIFFGGGQYRQMRFTSSLSRELSAGSLSSPIPASPDIITLAANLPPFLECGTSYSVTKNGLLLPAGNYIRTRQGTFLHRDFVLDVWLTVDPKNPAAFIGVGSGENGMHATPVNSIYMVVNPRGEVTMSTREGYGDSRMGKVEDSGEYVVRLEKKDMAVTYSIGTIQNNGDFTADVTQTFSDISKTPANFTGKNMHIFFGAGLYRQIRFTASPE